MHQAYCLALADLGDAADYNRAQTSTAHATDVAQKILDARLALTRLRQTYPQPRLTVPVATATLEEQIVTMQNLDDQMQELNKRVSSVKEKLRDAKAQVELARTERAEVEKAAALSTEQLGDDDTRLLPLYDWSVWSHHAVFLLV
jgi:chromosome segregation ATPase